MAMTYEQCRDQWAAKSRKVVEREIASMRRYMEKHSSAYAWHGKSMTPPGTLADADKLSAMREALEMIDAKAISP